MKALPKPLTSAEVESVEPQGDVFGPYELPYSGCNADWIAQQARDVFIAEGNDPSQYEQFLYYFPSASCGWGGLAMLGTPQQPERDSWYNGSFGCVVRNQEVRVMPASPASAASSGTLAAASHATHAAMEFMAERLAEVRGQKSKYKQQSATVDVRREGENLITSRIELANSLSRIDAEARGKESEARGYQRTVGMSPTEYRGLISPEPPRP